MTFFPCDCYRYDQLVNGIAKYDEDILFSIPWGLKTYMLHQKFILNIKVQNVSHKIEAMGKNRERLNKLWSQAHANRNYNDLKRRENLFQK